MWVHGKLFFVGIKKILICQLLIMFIKEKVSSGMLFEVTWEIVYRNKQKDTFLNILTNVINI